MTTQALWQFFVEQHIDPATMQPIPQPLAPALTGQATGGDLSPEEVATWARGMLARLGRMQARTRLIGTGIHLQHAKES
jgi:hypothetical protein